MTHETWLKIIPGTIIETDTGESDNLLWIAKEKMSTGSWKGIALKNCNSWLIEKGQTVRLGKYNLAKIISTPFDMPKENFKAKNGKKLNCTFKKI